MILHKKKSLKESIKFIFNPKVFFSKSATSDYKVLIKIMLISPHNSNNNCYLFEINFLDMGLFATTPKYIIISLFTLTHFIVDDFQNI